MKKTIFEDQVFRGIAHCPRSGKGSRVARVSIAFAISLLASCGSVQRTYWDGKVAELCRKDGGVTVYEQVRLTRDQFARLGGKGEIIPIGRLLEAAPNAPYVAQIKRERLSEDPEVYRSESTIVRTEDKKVLSRSIQYLRVGHQMSAYSCRDVGIPSDIERLTFQILGE